MVLVFAPHRPGHDAPAVLSVTETTMTVNNVEMELDGKGDGAVGAGIAGPNPYSKPTPQ